MDEFRLSREEVALVDHFHNAVDMALYFYRDIPDFNSERNIRMGNDEEREENAIFFRGDWEDLMTVREFILNKL